MERFLGNLGELVPEGGDLAFDAGRVTFRGEEGRLSLLPAVLTAEHRVVTVVGTLTAEGQGTLKILVLDRGELLDEVLFSTEPSRWPLSPEQRAAARCFVLVGPVDGKNYTAITLDDFFAEDE